MDIAARRPAGDVTSPRRATNGPKVKVGVSLDRSLHAWAMARVGPGKKFSTLTHAIERGLALLIEEEQRMDRLLREEETETKSDRV